MSSPSRKSFSYLIFFFEKIFSYLSYGSGIEYVLVKMLQLRFSGIGICTSQNVTASYIVKVWNCRYAKFGIVDMLS